MNVIEVVDVPRGASEDEARVLLNRPCEINRYMLIQVFLLPSGDTRAFYRLVSSAYDKKPGERNKLRAAQADDDAARAYIKANIGMTVREIIAGLYQRGITRKKTWVAESRIAIRGGTKHSE